MLLFGCAQAPPPAQPDTCAADEQAIRDMETAWVKEFAAKDMEVYVSKDDLAYSQRSYSIMTTDPKTKKAVTEKGTCVEVYKKQADGSWKVMEDIASPEAPAAPVK